MLGGRVGTRDRGVLRVEGEGGFEVEMVVGLRGVLEEDQETLEIG